MYKEILLFGFLGKTTVRWAQKIKEFVVSNYKNPIITLLTLILIILNNISSLCNYNYNSNL